MPSGLTRRSHAPRRLHATARVVRTFARYAWFIEDEVYGLDRLVRAGDVCLDIGAEYGLYTLVFAAQCGPSGGVHSIEPQPGAQRVLRAIVTVLGITDRVRTHSHALGLQGGHSWMSVPFRAGLPVHGRSFVTDGATSDGPNSTEFSSSRRIPVEVTTLDEFCEREHIDRLDFVKADVEGAELRVLRGGLATLERHRPILQLEIEQTHLAKYGSDAGELVEFLRRLDYRMHSWCRDGWRRTDLVTPTRRNYLFVPNGDTTGRILMTDSPSTGPPATPE